MRDVSRCQGLRSIGQRLGMRKAADCLLLIIVTAKDTRQLRGGHQQADGRCHIEQFEFTATSCDSGEYCNQFAETLRANGCDAIKIQEDLMLT